MGKEKKKLIIISSDNLNKKEGAAFSRVLNYQKALANVCFYYIDNISLNNSIKRFNNDFEINDDLQKSYWYRNVFSLFDFVTPIIGAFKIRARFNRCDTAILIYTSNFFQALLSIVFLRFIWRYKVIFEKNELALGIQLNIFRPTGLSLFFFLLIYPLKVLFAILLDILPMFSNHIIVISSSLEKKYSILKKRVSLIPILVDTSLFNNALMVRRGYVKNWVYMGALTIKKDDVLGIIRTIGQLNNFEKSRIKFDFIGSGNEKVINKMKKEIELLDLNEIISLKTSVSLERVPEILSEYDGALFVRQSNAQTRNGFSTKLGEYLAAGLVVICTPISDVEKYLKHKKNCLITEGNNIAELISYTLNNDMSQIKKEARIVATNAFDCYLYEESLRNIVTN